MHVPGPSTRLLQNYLHSASTRPYTLAVVRRGVHLRSLHVATNCARSAPPTFTLTNPQRTRPFSTTSISCAAQPAHPPAQRSQLVHCPTEEDLRELEDEDADGPEVELLPPEEATLEMTERAAEQLQKIAKRENNAEAALRIAVESGGCHGYQYKMELAKQRNPDDYLFSHPTVKPSNIVIDAVSMTLMKGCLIDFATELIGSTFRVVENPQAKGSGCGCGVSWELKV